LGDRPAPHRHVLHGGAEVRGVLGLVEPAHVIVPTFG
jgi:hypothetical protein